MNLQSINSTTAVVLIAHGSRLQAANLDLVKLKKIVDQQQKYSVVEIAYLELSPPTIPEAIESCLQYQMIQRVLLFPYFLSAGNHVTSDLKRYQTQFTQTYPDIEFLLCKPLGMHPLILEIVMDRLQEAEDAFPT